MRCETLINQLRGARILGSCKDVEVTDIVSDSRRVTPGALFVALKGPVADGHRHIASALKQGAAAVVLEDSAYLPARSSSIPWVLVEDARETLWDLTDEFFGHPGRRLRLIGITGTNGKTTTSYLVRSVLQANGEACGVIGTIGYQSGDVHVSLANTTPGIVELQKMLKGMADAGNAAVAMEVSSHALDQGRVGRLAFDAAIFTNLTQDHLDYHRTFDAYFSAKKKLFTRHVNERSALIINADDPYGARLLAADLAARPLSYGFSPQAHVRGEALALSREGIRMKVVTPGPAFDIESPLVGKHNGYNILAAVALGVSRGMSASRIQQGIRSLARVPGRLERFDSPEGFSVFVDYAHTDDALKNVLESLRQILHNGRVITVFGCGGDRDRGKRPKMGLIATELSDYCFITSDNPRSEEPRAIADDIAAGALKKNFTIQLDRLHAIRAALTMARPGDAVLVAGKGHEAVQITKDKVSPFDDGAVVAQLLQEISHV